MQTNTAVDLNVSDPVLRIKDVIHQTGLSKSTVYSLVKEGKFPAPIRLTEYASGWLLSEINQWKRERIAASRPKSVEER